MKTSTAWVAFKTIVTRESRRSFRVWPQTFLPAIVTTTLIFRYFWTSDRFKDWYNGRFSIYPVYCSWLHHDADHY